MAQGLQNSHPEMINSTAHFKTDQAATRAQGRQSHVTGAIQQASLKTGVDFDYLVKQAKVESSMNPNAKAKTSSATGLYQFIEQTWLQMMKQHGDEHGYGKYADAISQGRDGNYHVSNKGMRSQILNLRKDAQASSLMAAELATDNNAFLQQATGETPEQTDLYLAHFMGANGAANFLKSMKKNPWAPAASMFPDAARSNRGVFYAEGRPLSLKQVYDRFEAKFQGGGEGPVVQTANLNIYGSDQSFKPGKANLSLYENGSAPTQEINTWSRNNSIAQRIAANTRSTGLSVFSDDARDTSTQNTAREKIANSGLGFLQNPVQIMFMAQDSTNVFAHADSGRYNS